MPTNSKNSRHDIKVAIADNATQICPPSGCVPIVSTKQFLYPAGALGDFFGPGTTVGIPFAAQIGVRVNF